MVRRGRRDEVGGLRLPRETEAVWRRAGAAYRAAHAAGGSTCRSRYARGARPVRRSPASSPGWWPCNAPASTSCRPTASGDRQAGALPADLLDLSIEPADGSLFSIDLPSSARRAACWGRRAQPARCAISRRRRGADARRAAPDARRGRPRPAFAGVGAGAVASAIRHLSRQWGRCRPCGSTATSGAGPSRWRRGLGFIRSLISGEALMRRPPPGRSPTPAATASPSRRPTWTRGVPGRGDGGGQPGRRRALGAGRGAPVRLGERGAAVGLQTISSDPQLLVFDDGSRSWNGIPVRRAGGRPCGAHRPASRACAAPASTCSPRWQGVLLKLTPAGILQNGPRLPDRQVQWVLRADNARYCFHIKLMFDGRFPPAFSLHERQATDHSSLLWPSRAGSAAALTGTSISPLLVSPSPMWAECAPVRTAFGALLTSFESCPAVPATAPRLPGLEPAAVWQPRVRIPSFAAHPTTAKDKIIMLKNPNTKYSAFPRSPSPTASGQPPDHPSAHLDEHRSPATATRPSSNP